MPLTEIAGQNFPQRPWMQGLVSCHVQVFLDHFFKAFNSSHQSSSGPVGCRQGQPCCRNPGAEPYWTRPAGIINVPCIQEHNRQGTMRAFESIKKSTEDLMSDVYALYLARGDQRIPWYAKAIMVLTVVYALSPIDLIPDFIPYFGYLDDLVIIPAGIALAVSLMPKTVWEEYRERAREGFADIRLASWEGFLLILFIIREVWIILAIGLIMFVLGCILMVFFSARQGLLNIGTVIVVFGFMVLVITYEKFRRKVKAWREKAQSVRNKEPGLD